MRSTVSRLHISMMSSRMLAALGRDDSLLDESRGLAVLGLMPLINLSAMMQQEITTSLQTLKAPSYALTA